MRRAGSLDAFLLIAWCLVLAGQETGSGMIPFGHPPGSSPPAMKEGPGAPGGRQPLHPRFTPVATVVPPIGTPLLGAVTLPPTAALPGTFGQISGAFTPPTPSALTVGPPPVLLIPPVSLGQGGGIFAPSPPQFQVQAAPFAGNAPQASPGAGAPLFIPFAQGPTSILNQFIQPPLVPFGQVGVQVSSYLPGFFTGNANPFNRTCNYYYFQGCGPSGGAVTDFNFSTR